jgi:hypothetical protein
MISSKDVVLKSFLETLDRKKQENLTRFLPEKIRSDLEICQVKPFTTFTPFSFSSLLDSVHYSWFIPSLKSFSEQDSKLFLEIFSKEKIDKLTKILNFSPSKKKIPPLGKEYLRSVLLESLFPEEKIPLPKEFLPLTSASPLLALSKENLLLLIDYLGLYDLAKEMKKLIDKEITNKIFSFLGKDKLFFVKKFLSYKEPFTSAPLEISSWDGRKSSLFTLLHKRGLNRFAKALAFQHPDFIWNLLHTLDIGRGNFVSKLLLPKPSPMVSGVLLSNILELISHLKLTSNEANL